MLPEPLETQFTTYFASGTTHQDRPSVLYLLRRDACQCFGFDPNSYDVSHNPPINPHYSKVLWPGVMTIFSWLDLLAKYFAGSEEDNFPAGTQQTDQWRHKSGPRLKRFLEKYLTNNNAAEAEILYQLRCALDHSFALWARDRNGSVYGFVLSPPDPLHAGELLRQRVGATNGDTDSIIYIYELHKKFQEAINAFMLDYRTQLESNVQDQTTFSRLLDHYWFIGIAKASAFNW